MRTLAVLDYVIIVAYLALSLGIGVFYTRRASRSTESFFLSGRTLPWWLIGLSMAATNFSIDTPLAIAKYVYEHGIVEVWFFWSNAITALLATFLFSRLWRRAEVVTDAEIIERRYGGRPAALLRCFKGFYFGVLVNCFVMGWVLRALITVMEPVTDLDPVVILVIFTTIAFVYTVLSGLYGVVMTDFLQYIVCTAGSIALAIVAIRYVGGIDAVVAGIERNFGEARSYVSFVPTQRSVEAGTTVWSVFLTYLLVQWWAHKYADGGGKHIQRMCAAKNENHAMGGTFLFTMVGYMLQVWPWIVTALCAMALFGRLENPEASYARMMATVLPHGLLGLMVVSLLGAFMSTVDTHLNLGSAYVVNDIYRRFVVKGRSEKHYLLMSRVAMALLLAIGIAVGWQTESVGSAWKFIMAFVSGAGLVWIVRWFWWRVNAWSEFSAMLASGVVSSYLQLACPNMLYSHRMWIIIGASTVCWLLVTFLTPPVDDAKLLEFVRKVRPGSAGWNRVYRQHGLTSSGFFGRGVVGWLMALVCVFSANFAVGSLWLGRWTLGGVLGLIFVVSLVVLLRHVIKLRSGSGSPVPG